MKKTLIKISAIILICTMLFAGCSESFKPVSGGPSAQDIVSGNGGLAVQKGDFLYFINGAATTSAENDYGKPIKGAIVRLNLNDSNDKVVVVPKVVLSSYNKGGFYIFGDRIYYTSPSVKKDKKGNVLTSYLDFFSVKLDGSDNKEIITTATNSKPYKFYEADGKVYLIYQATVNAKEVINIIDTSTNKTSVFIDSFTGNPIFCDDGYVYYSQSVYKNEEKTETEPYNLLNRKKVGSAQSEEIAFSDGTTLIKSIVPLGEAAKDKKPSFMLTLVDAVTLNGKTTLFYNRKSVVNDKPQEMPTDFLYSFTIGSDKTINLVSTSAANSFDFTDKYFVSETSFLGVYKEKLYYVYYDAENPSALPNIELMAKPTKILFIDGDYAYYLNSSNYLYKKQFKGDGVKLATDGTKVLDEVAISTGNLMPEIINDYLYFNKSNGDYINYVYRINFKAEEPKDECVSIIAPADVKEEDK